MPKGSLPFFRRDSGAFSASSSVCTCCVNSFYLFIYYFLIHFLTLHTILSLSSFILPTNFLSFPTHISPLISPLLSPLSSFLFPLSSLSPLSPLSPHNHIADIPTTRQYPRVGYESCCL
jgi:hypothetical protein